ncbi:MAG: hypothetical protein A3F78_08610 [Burkholderiales bacterium RIFCSPLOWO2_12_FULL_61_40]|nr:MAG: hypothetical protein A3F78_08610 [Burkholderiales bacterium RIFCSPLOWO2_12_FULL_61_40]
MQIELRVKGTPDFPSRTYDLNEDDVRSILMDVCRAIGPRGEFVVSGFGQERWPVDVETDLPVFLEQLPSALRAVSEGVTADLDFYEQGIERSIVLEPANDKYMATCTSRTDWQPTPVVEEMLVQELEEMLLAVREEFMLALVSMAPDLARHPWIRQWLKGLDEE